MAVRLLVRRTMQRNASRVSWFVFWFMIVAMSTAAWASPAPPPIVGGKRAAPGDWPDVVAVLGREGSCTGTLIAPDVVLTAGHCADILPSFVIANTTDYAAEHTGETIAVKSTRAYPRWEEQYDVAVLVLEHVAKPKPRAIATGCLANRLLGELRPATVVGFGLTSPRADDDNTQLFQASVPILDPTCGSDPTCEPAVIPNGEFTAGGRGTDSCFGDSGGPAFLDGPDGPVLAGVVSRGLALPGIPCGNGGVYVRADKVTAWIERVTKRKLVRVGCGGPADDPEIEAADEAANESDGGGCSAGGGGSTSAVLVGIAMLAGVWRRRGARASGGGRGESRGAMVRAEAPPANVETGDGSAGDTRVRSILPIEVVALSDHNSRGRNDQD
jgi:hypothetical protein